MKSTTESDSYLAILSEIIRFAKGIIRKCNETRHLAETRLWRVALLAKVTSTADAVHTLIRNGHAVETKLLLRTMLDAPSLLER